MQIPWPPTRHDIIRTVLTIGSVWGALWVTLSIFNHDRFLTTVGWLTIGVSAGLRVIYDTALNILHEWDVAKTRRGRRRTPRSGITTGGTTIIPRL